MLLMLLMLLIVLINVTPTSALVQRRRPDSGRALAGGVVISWRVRCRFFFTSETMNLTRRGRDVTPLLPPHRGPADGTTTHTAIQAHE